MRHLILVLFIIVSVKGFIIPFSNVKTTQHRQALIMSSKEKKTSFPTPITSPARQRLEKDYKINQNFLRPYEYLVHIPVWLLASQWNMLLYMLDTVRGAAQSSRSLFKSNSISEHNESEPEPTLDSEIDHDESVITESKTQSKTRPPIVRERVVKEVARKRQLEVTHVDDHTIVQRKPVIVSQENITDFGSTTHEEKDLGTKTIHYSPSSSENDDDEIMVEEEEETTVELPVQNETPVVKGSIKHTSLEEEIQPIVERTIIKPHIIEEKGRIIRVNHSKSIKKD